MMNNTTEFSEIYSRFLFKVNDFDLIKLYEEDVNEILFNYLMMACTRFDVCRNNLSDYDKDFGYFNVQLTNEEITILATHMVCCWLEQHLNSIDLLRNRLNTKDATFFSPANLLTAIKGRYNEAMEQARLLTNEYSYKTGNFSGLIKK